jgi:hypothetical protein
VAAGSRPEEEAASPVVHQRRHGEDLLRRGRGELLPHLRPPLLLPAPPVMEPDGGAPASLPSPTAALSGCALRRQLARPPHL